MSRDQSHRQPGTPLLGARGLRTPFQEEEAERERESERKKERAREREVGRVRAYVYVLQRLLWLRSESQRTFRGSGMFEVALETLRFVHQRLTSNWWGLGCPVHCRGTDSGSLLASFLLGFLTPSALGGFFLLRLWTSPSEPPPSQCPAVSQRLITSFLHLPPCRLSGSGLVPLLG